MNKHTYFITGYPGFLAGGLIQQLIQDHNQQIDHIYLLVLPKLEGQACEEISKTLHINQDLFTIIPGDITKLNLGICEETNEELQTSVTHVFHLAAIYDLAVPKDLAYKVNVTGAQQVNDWVLALQKLKRYIYFSTAYVSGTRIGRIYEHERINHGFKNHYEQTKYEAELLVEDLKKQVPVTIMRLGIVKGHSKTGETTKFDGLYFMLHFLDHVRFLPTIPYLGGGTNEGNFVPVDYVVEATSYLSIASIGEGKTYHLTDPHPYKMREVYRLLAEAYIGKTPKRIIPIRIAKKALSASSLRKRLQVEKESLDYFLTHATYDCSQTMKDLDGSGISCPDLKDTIQPMIDFYHKYKDDYSKHIPIK